MLAGSVRSLLCATALLALLGAGDTWAQAPVRRVALVIGNSDYKEGGALKNPLNDARAMAAALRQLGFTVIARENATKQQMERAVGEFGDALAPGTVALFYFAGHGMQVNGRNFLVPVDANITTEGRVRLEALDVDLVLDQMAASGTTVNLMVLDACRNNPFEKRFRGGAGGGLAQINAPKGTLIAYATAPGKVAADGDGVNGIYTAKLLQAMKSPGLPIEEVFKRVRVDVARETKDEQTPWEASSLTGSFFFVEPPKPAGAPAGPSEAEKEMLFWESVKHTDDPLVLNAYLERYPSGTFAGLARAKIQAGENKQRQAALTAPPPVSAEQAIWEMVKGSTDPDIFQTFLEKYPTGAHAQEARSKLDALSKAGKKIQTAAAPAPSAPPPAQAATPTAAPAASAAKPGASPVDGIWHGSYSCSMSQRASTGPFNSQDRIFVVKDGKLTGRYEAQTISEQFLGSIVAGGKVLINGNGENSRALRGYTIDMFGKEEGGKFTATGKHGDRDCTLVYSKVQ